MQYKRLTSNPGFRWLAASLIVGMLSAELYGLEGGSEHSITPSLRAEVFLAEIPFEWRDGLMLVPVRINGAGPYSFVLISGASTTLIGKSRAEERGLLKRGRDFKARTPFGWDQRWRLAGVTLDLGGQRFSPAKLAAGSLTGARDSVDGQLGSDLFQSFITEIDFADKKIRLYNPKMHHRGESWKYTPLDLKQGGPRIELTIPRPGMAPAVGKFQVLLQNRGSMRLDQRFARSNALVSLAAPTMQFGKNDKGQYLAYAGRLPEVRLGTETVTNIEVLMAADAVNAVGYSFLRRFNLVFDYPRHRLWFTPNHRDSSRDAILPAISVPFLIRQEEEFQLCFGGAIWAVQDTPIRQFRAVEVVKFSSAYQAGLRRGDVLLTIDGHPPEKLSLAQWISKIGETNRAPRLEIQRRQKRIAIEIKTVWTDHLDY